MTRETIPTAETFYVFTYGTLRPGQYNARLMAGCARPGFAPEAKLPGHTLYANRSRSYPYLVADDTAEGAVTGNLYECRHNDAFQMVRRMELGAGYTESLVTVTLPDGREVEALAWLFNRPEWLGARITSGDWVEWERHNFPDWSGAFANVTRD